MRKRLLLAAIAVFTAIAASAAETPTWETEWAKAFERARKEKKLVFIDFYAAWCAPCRKMEGQTFRDKEVIARLSEFVLLRINVDSSDIDEKLRVRSFPTFSIRDGWEKQVIAIRGYYDWRTFVPKLDRVLSVAPELIASAEMLAEKETAQAHIRRAAALDRAGALADARRSYLRAAELAGDPQTAQIAKVEAAVASIRLEQVAPALVELQQLAAAPANKDCEAAIWMAIGFGEKSRNKSADALAAYRCALEVCTPGTPLEDQIRREMAKLER